VELRDIYRSLSTVRAVKSSKLQLTGHVAQARETTNAYRIFVWKPLGKRLHGRHGVTFEHSIAASLGEEVEIISRYYFEKARYIRV
jgi:hypothetical protein